jgi:hypothetical protein
VRFFDVKYVLEQVITDRHSLINNMNTSTEAVVNSNAVAIPNVIATNVVANQDDADSFKIELLDIGDSTPITERLLQVLQDVYNDAGKYTCHGGTTHIMVLYDNGKVVGGALLRISNRVIVIKRLCVGVENRNSIHTSTIIQYCLYFIFSWSKHVQIAYQCLPTILNAYQTLQYAYQTLHNAFQTLHNV